MPEVSIITPLYNGARFIAETILSVIGQTYTDWEMIIVDDCSIDHPENIISPYAENDQRIKWVRLDRNSGAAAARNVALGRATGRFIAFLDGDDTWKPEKLQRQISLMDKLGWAFSFCSYEIMDPTGKKTGKIIHAPSITDYRHYLRDTVIGCLTVIIDREKTGTFEMPLIRSSHDMALWLELMKRGFTAHGIDEVMASYRLVSSSNTANKFRAAADVWQVYRKIEQLSFLCSIYNFAGYIYHALMKRI